MTARAMWKGVLGIGNASVPVKLYSAIEDRDIHFRLLHATDLVPVTQAMVNPRTDEIVPHDQTRRGYATPEGGLVIVHADELAALTPQESRDIEFTRLCRSVRSIRNGTTDRTTSVRMADNGRTAR